SGVSDRGRPRCGSSPSPESWRKRWLTSEWPSGAGGKCCTLEKVSCGVGERKQVLLKKFPTRAIVPEERREARRSRNRERIATRRKARTPVPVRGAHPATGGAVMAVLHIWCPRCAAGCDFDEARGVNRVKCQNCGASLVLGDARAAPAAI